METPAPASAAPSLRAIILLGLALLLAGDWLLPLIDRDEPRFAEASREMIRRGDFLVPYFNGEYRFDKPPLIYWCQAAAFSVLGENELAARLPSALFATATAALLLLWGRRLGEARAGFVAAIIFLTCLQVLVHGRLAVADMPMVFFFAAAVWSGWEMSRPAPGQGWWWLFYASLALGFLAKGPEAWLPLAGLWIGRWRRPREYQWKGMALGAALTLTAIGLWAGPALVRTRGEFFTVGIGRHVIYRSFGVMEGHGAAGWFGYVKWLPFFFLTFFASFFPWSIWVPHALWRGENDALGKYLLTQAAVVFAVFTVVATKLPHYTLPAFPCLALWLARRRAGEPAMGRWRARLTGAMIGLTVAAALCFPWVGSRMAASALWRRAGAAIRPETKVAAVGFDEPSLVWEFSRATTNSVAFLAPRQEAAFLRGPGARCLILPAQDWAALASNAPPGVVTYRASGFDTAGFKHWDLVAAARR